MERPGALAIEVAIPHYADITFASRVQGRCVRPNPYLTVMFLARRDGQPHQAEVQARGRARQVG